MAGAELLAFPDRATLTYALAEAGRAALAEALAARGVARAALSGGRSPGPLYRALAESDLDWPSVTLALVDERWVPPDHEASNGRLVRESFAPALAKGARLAPMKTPAASPATALGEVEPVYCSLRPFDLVILGMGPDGHTASWFPHAEGLAAALDPPDDATVAAVRAAGSPVAGAYVERMTLTRPAVAEARQVALMITGEDKRAALARAQEPGPEADMPVRALLHREDAALTVYWSP